MKMHLLNFDALAPEQAQHKASIDSVTSNIIQQVLQRYVSAPCVVEAQTYVACGFKGGVLFEQNGITLTADRDCVVSLLQAIACRYEQRRESSPSDLERSLVVQVLRLIHEEVALLL